MRVSSELFFPKLFLSVLCCNLNPADTTPLLRGMRTFTVGLTIFRPQFVPLFAAADPTIYSWFWNHYENDYAGDWSTVTFVAPI